MDPAFVPYSFTSSFIPSLNVASHCACNILPPMSSPKMSADYNISATTTYQSRRAFLAAVAATSAAALLPQATSAGQTTMSGDYKVDAALVLTDMRSACSLGRGAPEMAETVGKTRKEMNDFVALYRRNNKVSGSTSFSTLYTAINTLSGHYASYGSSYPVPEKRKKRLTQQFSEIDRALNRGR